MQPIVFLGHVTSVISGPHHFWLPDGHFISYSLQRRICAAKHFCRRLLS